MFKYGNIQIIKFTILTFVYEPAALCQKNTGHWNAYLNRRNIELQTLGSSDHKNHRNIIGLSWVIFKFLFQHGIAVNKRSRKN